VRGAREAQARRGHATSPTPRPTHPAQWDHQLQALLNRRLPRLAAHLHAHGIVPGMYATQWMLTIFAYSFPLPAVVRVWDAFMFEGWKVVFRVALAALTAAQAALLAAGSFEELMNAFKALPESMTDVSVERAFDIK